MEIRFRVIITIIMREVIIGIIRETREIATIPTGTVLTAVREIRKIVDLHQEDLITPIINPIEVNTTGLEEVQGELGTIEEVVIDATTALM